jgi:hypothetical protein
LTVSSPYPRIVVSVFPTMIEETTGL